MKKRGRRPVYANELCKPFEKNYVADNLKGLGTQILTVPRGLKGFTFGAANKGRKFTKEEIERYVTAKKIAEKHNQKAKK